MSGRLAALREYDKPLTNVVQGYKNSNFIGEKLFPVVRHEKEGGYIPKFGKESFRLYATERGIRAKSNRRQPVKNEKIPFLMEEHDIEAPLDYREINEASEIFDIEKTEIEANMDIILLRREYSCGKQAQDPANYDSSNKEALTGDDRFNDYTNSDPITVIEDAKESVRNRIAMKPNTMVIGAEVYKWLKNHPKLISKIQYSMKGILTKELLAELFGVKNVEVGEAIYVDEKGNSYDVWGKNIVLAWVPEGSRNMYTPSYGYTIAKKNYPLADKYPENGGKVGVVRATDFFVTKITGSDAGYLITDVID